MIKITDNTNGIHGDEIADILSYAIKKLGLEDADVMVCINNAVLDKFSKADVEMQAIINEAAPGKYVIFLRAILDGGITSILCHEAVHLSQMIAGRLKFDHKTGICTWGGQRYAASYPYNSRPWEIEAFSKQGRLVKGYRRTKKKIC